MRTYRRAPVSFSLIVLSFVIVASSPSPTLLGQTSRSVVAISPDPVYLPLVMKDAKDLAVATFENILAMVEPSTGLPNDRIDASLLDIMPQFATARTAPYASVASGASLVGTRCTTSDCRYSGNYGLKLAYDMPSGKWGSYAIESPEFNVEGADYLEAMVKGALGGERFEFVLWSNCSAGFPGRPNSALVSVSSNWSLVRIPLADFRPFADLSSLCRLSIGFSDSIHPGGTVYLDRIAFVDSSGSRMPLHLDEETNVTNIGLYIASLLGAVDIGLDTYDDVAARLGTTLGSLEALTKWHGFPQTHNHVVSLTPSNGDRCISTVDTGNLAAGLILLRQRMPELAVRASHLLDAMDWSWLYDSAAGLPYGCRYPDGSASTSWHYDWLAADSRLAHFIGIGTGKMPAGSWSNLRRTHELPRCTDLWHFEPGWDGGGLFMAFLPSIFLDEAKNELGTSAFNIVRDQVCKSQQLQAPAWGWSATALPPYGEEYCGYGCINDDLLVPHAALLAAEAASPTELTQNLAALESLGARAPATDGTRTFDYGFRASVNWRTKQAATVYLVLDQSMGFLSLVNQRTGGQIRKHFCGDAIVQAAITAIPDYNQSCTGR